MILIALGANLPSSSHGAAVRTIDHAVEAIARAGMKVCKKSRMWLTAPVPASDQPWFVNAVISVSTSMLPVEVLKTLQRIEKDFGRTRWEPNAPRTLDLDLLAYHDVVMNEADLTLPHPRMQGRAFVLKPLAEVDKTWVHPVLRVPLQDLIAKIPSDQQAFPFLPIGPVLMGVLNVTPDSLSDGGEFEDLQAAIDHGLHMIEEGARIIDIGGESTRPGADPISEDVEINRILPVIEGLKKTAAKGHCLLSVDTRRAAVMRVALQHGVNFINDISALTDDPDSFSVVLDHRVPVCLMHKQGSPKDMQENPFYNNVLDDVFKFLQERIEALSQAGLPKSFMIADPGIGFGKTVEHNLALLQNLELFHALQVPLLVGMSRKSMISEIDRQVMPRDRLGGSLAGAIHAFSRGAKIVRVHDVAATRQAYAVWQALDFPAAATAELR